MITELKEAIELLERKSIRIPECGCQIWMGSEATGYGHLQYKNKFYLAHRLAWIIEHGEIPKGFGVCHKCDTPLCINTRHLFLGTPKDNAIDRNKKGRGFNSFPLYGAQHPKSKLTEKEVMEILSDNRKPNALAKQYNVHVSTIYSIKKHRNWKCLLPGGAELRRKG